MTKAKLAAAAPPVLAMATLVTVGIVFPGVNRDEHPTDNEAEVCPAAQAYLDGLLHADVATLESAFHPETRFQGLRGERVRQDDVQRLGGKPGVSGRSRQLTVPRRAEYF